jgi:hypothetical protein
MSKDLEKYDEKQAQERFEAALRGALKTPPKPLNEKPKARKRNSARKKRLADSFFLKESALDRRTARISPRRRKPQGLTYCSVWS